MKTGFQFALYEKDEPLRRLLYWRVDRVKVRSIRSDEEFIIERIFIRILNLGSIRET